MADLPTVSITKEALVCICAAALVSACGGDSPTGPSGTSTITFQQVTPASGSTIIVSQGNPPGTFILLRGSGQLTIPMVLRSTRDADWAQLNVYLLAANTIDSYCGQNLPDSPTWGPWVPRRNVQVTVSGFQIYSLPCEVSGIRAMLHLRQSGLLIPPTPTQTLAEGTLPVTFFLRR